MGTTISSDCITSGPDRVVAEQRLTTAILPTASSASCPLVVSRTPSGIAPSAVISSSSLSHLESHNTLMSARRSSSIAIHESIDDAQLIRLDAEPARCAPAATSSTSQPLCVVLPTATQLCQDDKVVNGGAPQSTAGVSVDPATPHEVPCNSMTAVFFSNSRRPATQAVGVASQSSPKRTEEEDTLSADKNTTYPESNKIRPLRSAPAKKRAKPMLVAAAFTSVLTPEGHRPLLTLGQVPPMHVGVVVGDDLFRRLSPDTPKCSEKAPSSPSMQWSIQNVFDHPSSSAPLGLTSPQQARSLRSGSFSGALPSLLSPREAPATPSKRLSRGSPMTPLALSLGGGAAISSSGGQRRGTAFSISCGDDEVLVESMRRGGSLGVVTSVDDTPLPPIAPHLLHASCGGREGIVTTPMSVDGRRRRITFVLEDDM